MSLAIMQRQMSDYHSPVMLSESVDALIQDKNGIYVDLTFGGGGHSKEIIKRLGSKGRLYAFDQDEDAIGQMEADQKLTLSLSNFRFFANWMDYYGIKEVDGIFADLGVSSWQIDEESRGFAWRMAGGLLDMRMNEHAEMTASDLVMSYSQDDIVKVLSRYGEVRNSKSLARAIVETRKKWGKEVSVSAFNSVVEKMCIGERGRYLSQVYQALRIEVNKEMQVLEEMLEQCGPMLKIGGRLAVLTYHSLEDKLVKKYMKSGSVGGEIERDDFGRSMVPFKGVGTKFLVPTDDEIELNSRSRSAKLRVVEKV